MSEQELKALRLRIDALDEKVLELISERALRPGSRASKDGLAGRRRSAGVLSS